MEVVTAAALMNLWRSTARLPVPFACSGSMRIITYEGQAQREAGRMAAVVTAAELAAADVVLTTYDVLRRDVHQQPSPNDVKEYAMRRRKRYEVGISTSQLQYISGNARSARVLGGMHRKAWLPSNGKQHSPETPLR